jgi:hypothetical protein
VQSNETNHGPWTDITARLTVRDAQSNTQEDLLPFLFNPNHTIVVSKDGSHPDRWGDSFNFWLNYGDTQRGVRELKATISSLSGGFQTDTGDDHVWTHNAVFNSEAYLNVYGLVWAATNDDKKDGTLRGPSAPWSDFYGHQQYVNNVFPVTEFAILPLPGIGTAPPNPQPFGNQTDARVGGSRIGEPAARLTTEYSQ